MFAIVRKRDERTLPITAHIQRPASNGWLNVVLTDSDKTLGLKFNKKPTKLKTVPKVLCLPNSCNSHDNLANLRQGKKITEAALGKLGRNHEA